MKKFMSLIVTLLLVASFAVFALGSTEEKTADQGDGEKSTVSQNVSNQGEESVQQTEADNSSIGDYSVVIDSCRLAKDYQGKKVVIVKYIFTNVDDDEAASFYVTFDEAVYQNGVGLNEAYVLDDSANYSADNQTKEIKKGATIEVEVAYELNDETTDIEVEVKELFSFEDTTITKTLSIKN